MFLKGSLAICMKRLILIFALGVLIPSLNASATNAGGLEVLTLKRINQFDRNDEGCSRWGISKAEVVDAFKSMKQVESQVWGMTCEAYSCAYVGKAKYLGKTYDIEVNAAGAIILFDNKDAIYFIETVQRKYFLSACQTTDTVPSKPPTALSKPPTH